MLRLEVLALFLVVSAVTWATLFEPSNFDQCRYIYAHSVRGNIWAYPPLYRFKTEEEVLTIANDTPYGLATYFYSGDINRVWRVSEALEYGMIAKCGHNFK